MLARNAEGFELACQWLCAPIAEEVTDGHAGDVRYYASPDGGVEAKTTAERDGQVFVVGVQAKHYARFDDEVKAVRKSFARTLTSPEHRDITHYVWCSATDATAASQGEGRRGLIDALARELAEKAYTAGRVVELSHLGPIAIAELLVTRHPAAVPLCLGERSIALTRLLANTSIVAEGMGDRVAASDRESQFPSALDQLLESVDDGFRLRDLIQRVDSRVTNLRRMLAEAGPLATLPASLQQSYAELDAALGAVMDAWSVQAAHLTDAVGAHWPVRRLRSLARSTAEVLQAPDQAIDRAADEYLAYTRAHGPPLTVPLFGPGEHGRARLVALGAVRLQVDAARLVLRLNAEAATGVAIEGGWGTGKTFHFGHYGRERARGGAPTVLARAREFKEEERWLDATARLQHAGLTGQALLAHLELYALKTSRRAVLIIDGIDEAPASAGRSHAVRLRELTADLRHSDFVFTVVSRRDDAMVEWTDDDDEWPVHVHKGVDVAEAWHVLQDEFKLPPLAGGVLLHPDYRRPLMLRLLARCLVSRADAPVGPVFPPPVSELIDEWLRVLKREYLAGTVGEQHRAELLSHIVSIVAEDAVADGTIAVQEILRRLRDVWSSEEVGQAVGFLVRSGFLEHAAGHDGVRFALQRVAEHHEAIRTAGSRRQMRAAIDQELAAGEAAAPWPLTRGLADLAPQRLGIELPALWRRRCPPIAAVAFAASLILRAPEQVTPQTRTLAARFALDRDAAGGIWLAVFANGTVAGHPLGAAWGASVLDAASPRARDRGWTHGLAGVLEHEGSRIALAEQLLWLSAEQRASRIEPQHARELLSWMKWSSAHPLTAIATPACRLMTDLLMAHPTLTPTLLRESAQVGDPSVLDAAWSAVCGAFLRATGDDTRRTLADGAAAASRGWTWIPAHFRMAETIFRLQEAIRTRGLWRADWPRATSFRAFLGNARVEPHVDRRPVKDAKPPRHWSPIEADAGRFTDETPFVRHEREVRLAMWRMGYRGRRLRAASAGDVSSGLTRARYVDAARQRWLARQAAQHKVSRSREWRAGEGWITPKSTEAGDVRPGALWEQRFDPSLDLEAPFDAPQEVTAEAWWVSPGIRALADPSNSRASLPVQFADWVELRDGTDAWLVLRGDFRVQIPTADLRRDEATLKAFLEPEGHTIVVESADETVQSGADRHLFITITGVLSPEPLTALPSDRVVLDLQMAEADEDGVGRRFLGEELLPAHRPPAAMKGPPTAAVETFRSPIATDFTVHHPSVWLPSRVVRSALALTWTGHELDFASLDGLAVRTTAWGRTTVGPRIVVIKRTEAVRLGAAGLRLGWIIDVADMRNYDPNARPKARGLAGLATDGAIRELDRTQWSV